MTQTRIDILKNILETETGFDIQVYPDLPATTGYLLYPIDKFPDVNPYLLFEQYALEMKLDSLVTLESSINTFHHVDSIMGDGYKYDGTTTEPIWIDVKLTEKHHTLQDCWALMEINGRWDK